ncbi:TolC family protein [Pseudoduganella namucuonensis]|uniref:Outer membrane protein TolC n=1 Tax=Pseudoduganella namucuonensis TaxID=1035707 RepID=A0A1I7GRI3_9BURK|nr:TolC family protein [Pseudoduganella namucuonensis]SFU50866.1 Outer membrane protein TolC [Pseudoduganella namucuonensis]
MRITTTLPAAALALLLTGCASLSGDSGFGAVAQATQERIGQQGKLLRTDEDRKALADLLQTKLKQPLTADDAVHIALLNNRGLQATYWSLGVAEADLVQAGSLQNPAFGFKRTHGGGDTAIERTLTLNLVNLITLPLSSRIEARRFEQAKLTVANEALKVAADTRRAYYEAVAAAHSQEYARQVRDAAEAGAELGQRMQKAGNWSKLDAAREQAFHADAYAEAARADKQVVASREKLVRLLGLTGADISADKGFKLPPHLPELPSAPRELADTEQAAIDNRLDIQAARLDTEHTASSLGLTRATRFVNVLELGGIRESASGEPKSRGYEITLEIPLFDWGTARAARAEAVYMQSVNKLAETAANARSEARESYQDYRGSYELARHYRDSVIPLRRQISQETMLRYNGMLASVFELLADAREQSTAVSAYINALKDFWIAETSLEAAVGGKLPATGTEKTGVKP